MSATPVVSCSGSEGFSPTHPASFIFWRDHRAAVVPPFDLGTADEIVSLHPGIALKVTGLQMSGTVMA